jgi:hypothetical protein
MRLYPDRRQTYCNTVAVYGIVSRYMYSHYFFPESVIPLDRYWRFFYPGNAESATFCGTQADYVKVYPEGYNALLEWKQARVLFKEE